MVRLDKAVGRLGSPHCPAMAIPIRGCEVQIRYGKSSVSVPAKPDLALTVHFSPSPDPVAYNFTYLRAMPLLPSLSCLEWIVTNNGARGKEETLVPKKAEDLLIQARRRKEQATASPAHVSRQRPTNRGMNILPQQAGTSLAAAS